MVTGILPAALKPASPTASSTNFLIYNPGTETAHTLLRIAGDVGENGLLIRNFTTGQRCAIKDLKDNSLLPSACLELDSRKGQTRIALGEETKLAYPFHEEGYITLAPCTPFVRALEVGHVQGSNQATSQGGFLPHMKGQYLYLGRWLRIQQVTDASHAILSGNAASTGTTLTPVATMNEIELSGTVQLTRFDIEVFPRVR